MIKEIELMKEVLKTIKENEERLSIMLAQMRLSIVVLEDIIKKMEDEDDHKEVKYG